MKRLKTSASAVKIVIQCLYNEFSLDAIREDIGTKDKLNEVLTFKFYFVLTTREPSALSESLRDFSNFIICGPEFLGAPPPVKLYIMYIFQVLKVNFKQTILNQTIV